MTGTPGPGEGGGVSLWVGSQDPRPQKAEGRLGKSGSRLRGLCDRAQGTSVHLSGPWLARRRGHRGQPVFHPLGPDGGCRAWGSAIGLLPHPPWAQETPCPAALQALSLSGAHLGQSGRPCLSPPFGNVRERREFFKCMYFDFLGSPPCLAVLPASCC